eukprot:6400306-Lingulodinium_polyedra.AAC.1
MTTFWAAYKDVCAMVMPLEETEALFQAQGKWTSVEDKVNKVCSTSEIGHRMFGFVQSRLVADKLQQLMDEFELHLAALPQYNEDTYKREMADCKKKLTEISNLDKVPARRAVTINYRGILAAVQVGSISEEIEL